MLLLATFASVLRTKNSVMFSSYVLTKTADDKMLWNRQFARQRYLFQQKLKDYWSTMVDSCRNDPKALWSKLRAHMSLPLPQNPSHFSADDFAAFFTSKVGNGLQLLALHHL